MTVDGRADRKVTKAGTPVQLTVTVPTDLRKDGRTFYLIRFHDGNAEVLATGTGDTLEVESDLFSPYHIAYKDATEPEPEPTPVTKVTVSFNANSGTGTMANVTGNTGDVIKLPANTFKRSGYTFAGWNTKADGTGVAYADGASVKLEGNLKLYAQWKKTSNPQTPNGPAKGSTPSTGGTRSIPKTGDDTPVATLFALALAGIAAVAVGMARRVKE